MVSRGVLHTNTPAPNAQSTKTPCDSEADARGRDPDTRRAYWRSWFCCGATVSSSTSNRPDSLRARAVRIVLWLSVFCVCVVLGILWKDRERVRVNRDPILYIDPVHLDYGEVWAQKILPLKIPIQNTSDEDIEIVEFLQSPCCMCEFSPSNIAIPAGATREVDLSINLIPPDTKPASAVEDVAFSIIAFVKGHREQKWKVSGRVKNVVSFDPPRVDYATTIQRGLRFPSQSVTVHRHYPLQDFRVECDSPDFRVTLENALDKAADPRLVIEPLECMPDGSVESSLQIHAVGDDGIAIPPAPLRVVASVAPNVRASPARVEFGLRKTGEIAQQTLVLESATSRSFDVLDITCSSHTSSMVPRWIPGSSPGRREYAIVQRFAMTGNQEETVKVTTRSVTGEYTRLTIPVHAHVLK